MAGAAFAETALAEGRTKDKDDMKKNHIIDLIIIAMGIFAVITVFNHSRSNTADAAHRNTEQDTYVCTYTITVGKFVKTLIRGKQVSIKEYQESLGFTGRDVDGVVGKKTIEATLYKNSEAK